MRPTDQSTPTVKRGVVAVGVLLVLAVAALALIVLSGDDDQVVDTGSGIPQAAQPLMNRQFVGNVVTEDGEPRLLAGATQLRVTFVDDGTISAWAGCNNMGGDADLEALGDGRLVVEAVAMTEMACAEEYMTQESWFADLLASGLAWRLDGDDLVLESDTVSIRLTDEQVVRPDLELERTSWLLDTLFFDDTAQSAPGGISASIVFNEDGTIDVQSTCNSGRGTWTREGETVRVSQLAMSRMACSGDPGTVEAAILDVLGESLAVEIEGDRLTLLTPERDGLGFAGAIAEDAPAVIPPATQPVTSAPAPS